jgi:hypothetical protein
VQIGKHVEEVLAQALSLRRRDQVGALRAVEHDTVDEAHHVEGRAVDLDVGAQAERRRNRHGCEAYRGDDAMLAGHVVCGRQHLGQRRTAQHHATPVGVVDTYVR